MIKRLVLAYFHVLLCAEGWREVGRCISKFLSSMSRNIVSNMSIDLRGWQLGTLKHCFLSGKSERFYLWNCWSIKLQFNWGALWSRRADTDRNWALWTLPNSWKSWRIKKNYKTSCQKVKLKIFAKGHWCENQIYKHLVTVRVPPTHWFMEDFQKQVR